MFEIERLRVCFVMATIVLLLNGCGGDCDEGVKPHTVIVNLSDASRRAPEPLAGVVSVGSIEARFDCPDLGGLGDAGTDPNNGMRVSCGMDGRISLDFSAPPPPLEQVVAAAIISDTTVLYGSAIIDARGDEDECYDLYYTETSMIVREVTSP